MAAVLSVSLHLTLMHIHHLLLRRSLPPSLLHFFIFFLLTALTYP